MAQRVAIAMPGNIVQQHFTMNETPVGESQQNINKADVELIQFFLWEFYSVHTDLFSLLPRVSRTPAIVIDGKCGMQTKEGIYKFQLFHQLRGVPILVDGIAHETKNLRTRAAAAIYTVWHLNQWFFRFSPAPLDQKEDLRNNPVVQRNAPHLMRELNRIRAERVIY